MMTFDEALKILETPNTEYLTGTFICSRCNKERPQYRSVIIPQRASSKLIRVCERCWWEIYDKLKGDTNGQ